ncbi:MAG TPA: hypothetical protein VKT29_01360 [Terriglobales bacterium]|nr:hypothetical protein [Terriglobales bacterium]
MGKFALAMVLLLLCIPSAARLSRHTNSGQGWNLPGWIVRVCHGSPVSRGTQRRNRKQYEEPLNALLEQQSAGDHAPAGAPQAMPAEAAFTPPHFVVPGILENHGGPAGDPAFLCIFLI